MVGKKLEMKKAKNMTSHAWDQRDQGIFVTDPRKSGHFLIGFKSRDVRKFEENRWISANPIARFVVVSLQQALVRAVTTLVAFPSCPHPFFPTILSPFFSFSFSSLTGVMRAVQDTLDRQFWPIKRRSNQLLYFSIDSNSKRR